MRTASQRHPGGFTLIELLAVIAIIAILSSMLIPALGKGRVRSKTNRCASNMRNWAWATQMYLNDYDDHLPLFGDLSSDSSLPYWHGKLAPYLGKRPPEKTFYGHTEIYYDEIRKCPGGANSPPPFYKGTNSYLTWNSWVGANFGALGQPLTAPFFYGDKTPPLNVSRIARPADAMMYMDSLTHVIYSPIQDRYQFALDFDGDGAADTMPVYPDVPFNYARPTVHNNAANVTLLDGHVERVPFKQLWNVDQYNRVTHSFWYLND